MLTALSQAIRDEPATPLGPGYLIATLGRLARLMAALEDLAHYGGAARLGTSWSRIGGLLAEAERLAHAGARQPPAGGSRCIHSASAPRGRTDSWQASGPSRRRAGSDRSGRASKYG